MTDFDEGQESEKHEEWEKQIKEDRFTSLMFGPRRDQDEKRSHHREEPKHSSSTIDYEELMINIDNLVESFRGLKPLFSKVMPYVQQFWKKK
ncbi:hypothetical protein [Bacillus sp. USDA818B3_A]|uniref:hypothetical protein n=1 Tax=Bacillus sp. USDA818B3_A TaxID=2698834 RepID=UPI00136C5066|nr:hypothetical protein [Bacillus sp. USDA818B3_A]